jgi:hypothetical protein
VERLASRSVTAWVWAAIGLMVFFEAFHPNGVPWGIPFAIVPLRKGVIRGSRGLATGA